MRRYRARHKNDPVYKARIKEEKKKQLAKHSPERRKETYCKRQKRHREKYKDTPEYKAANIAVVRAWRKKNPEKEKAAKKNWHEKNRDKVVVYLRDWRKSNPNYIAKSHQENMTARGAERRARKNNAMPPWANRAAIAAIYRAAKQLSAETGIDYHIDHIVPLKHKLVCGLHVPANLRLLPGAENLSKGNKFEVA